ncbi:MAG: cytochrome c biogenesis protein ResB, partial [Methylophilaceae bacterium]
YWFDFFKMLGMYDIYHSAWFLLILLFLVTSTSLCVYRQTPQILKDMRQYREHLNEKSLRQFTHQKSLAYSISSAQAQAKLSDVLQQHDYRWRQETHADGSVMLAAKTGNYQKLGYIFTHVAIIIICIGGLMDGNVPLKIQELLGDKVVETRDIPVSQVSEKSKLSVRNLSFRANLTLPEGSRADVAFERVRDGYMVQQLPFTLALEDFRIEHYPTGQPKSFESDLVIMDPELKQPLKQTIKVNHPLTYKGITIYQSDFQDGGTDLQLNAWDLTGARNQPVKLAGKIFQQTQVGEGQGALQIEFDD